jgi:hypothetical protein
VVSVEARYQQSTRWFASAALTTLGRVFGRGSLRLCEACSSPRTFVEEGRLEQTIGSPGISELVRLDESLRGKAPPARAALWLDESAAGVSLRIVQLDSSRLVLAENVDPALEERARSTRTFTLTRELERRARGDGLAHAFVDFAVYPGQHLSMDWVDQWGDSNQNLSGVTLSLFDPILGLGGCYYRVIPEAYNLLVGGQVIMSVPTAFVRSASSTNTDVIDPLLTGVLVMRVPLFNSNYGLFFSASTNGRVGVGLSALNFSVLPVLP